jgi:hypothetical protein
LSKARERRNEELMFNGHSFSFVKLRVLERNSSNGWQTIEMYLTTLRCVFENG